MVLSRRVPALDEGWRGVIADGDPGFPNHSQGWGRGWAEPAAETEQMRSEEAVSATEEATDAV